MKKESDAKGFQPRIKPEEQDIQKALGAIYVVRAKNAQNRGNTAEMTEQMPKLAKHTHQDQYLGKPFQIWWETRIH